MATPLLCHRPGERQNLSYKREVPPKEEYVGDMTQPVYMGPLFLGTEGGALFRRVKQEYDHQD